MEADDLSNGVTEKFTAKNEIKVPSLSSLPWLVLPEFMKEGLAFFDYVQNAKKNRLSSGMPLVQSEPKRSKDSRLRVREPW